MAALTPDKVSTLRLTWAMCKEKPTFGKDLFEYIFVHEPAALPMFPFYDPQNGKNMNDKMFNDPGFKRHTGYVVNAVTTVVDGLDDLPAVVKVLTDLGDSHFKKGVQAEHYYPVGAAILYTLQMHLGPDWNDEVQNAWETAYGVISATM